MRIPNEVKNEVLVLAATGVRPGRIAHLTGLERQTVYNLTFNHKDKIKKIKSKEVIVQDTNPKPLHHAVAELRRVAGLHGLNISDLKFEPVE